MTTLKFIITILHICDGDKHPNLRHKYTIQDMIDAHTIAELGINVANVTFYDL